MQPQENWGFTTITPLACGPSGAAQRGARHYAFSGAATPLKPQQIQTSGQRRSRPSRKAAGRQSSRRRGGVNMRLCATEPNAMQRWQPAPNDAGALSRWESWLPTVLSVIAGMVDLLGFLTLGNIFTAHITGNLVLIAARRGARRTAESDPGPGHSGLHPRHCGRLAARQRSPASMAGRWRGCFSGVSSCCWPEVLFSMSSRSHPPIPMA